MVFEAPRSTSTSYRRSQTLISRSGVFLASFENKSENVNSVQPTNATLIVSPPSPGGFRAFQARFHQPISGSGEEDGAEGDEAQIFERNQARHLSTRTPGEKVQTKEELHKTRSTQW